MVELSDCTRVRGKPIFLNATSEGFVPREALRVSVGGDETPPLIASIYPGVCELIENAEPERSMSKVRAEVRMITKPLNPELVRPEQGLHFRHLYDLLCGQSDGGEGPLLMNSWGNIIPISQGKDEIVGMLLVRWHELGKPGQLVAPRTGWILSDPILSLAGSIHNGRRLITKTAVQN